MPALPRPETDYERWIRDRNPSFQLTEPPQYGPDPDSSHEHVIGSPSSMKHVSEPQPMLKDQHSPSSTGKTRLLAEYSRAWEVIVDLVTALVILGILLFAIWVVKARRRSVPRILGRVSIREKRNV